MFDKVTEILDGYTEVRKEEMTPDMLLVDDLGLNSVSYFAIVFDLEDAFDIEIPDDAVKSSILFLLHPPAALHRLSYRCSRNRCNQKSRRYNS